MAFKKIARKSSDFKVVFTVPDFCWSPPPAPPSVPPILFPLFADLGGAKSVAKDVRLNASLLLSLKPVRRTKLMATKSPDQVARAYFAVTPPNHPGQCIILPRLKSASATSYAPAICSTWTTSSRRNCRPNPVFPAKPPPLVWSRNYYFDQDLIRLLGGFNLYQLASNTHWTFYKIKRNTSLKW